VTRSAAAAGVGVSTVYDARRRGVAEREGATGVDVRSGWKADNQARARSACPGSCASGWRPRRRHRPSMSP
jgi:hypothetical protein